MQKRKQEDGQEVGLQPYSEENMVPQLAQDATELKGFGGSESFGDEMFVDARSGARRYVYLMSDYIEVLLEVFRKNMCPCAKYHNIEMAVFYYVQNLAHKCESILMDYWEYFTIGDKKNIDLKSNEKINNRLRRIYGSTHESVYVEEKKNNFGNPLKLGGDLVTMVGETAIRKKTTEEWIEE